jgi:Galactose-3-O-sulfotransferase
VNGEQTTAEPDAAAATRGASTRRAAGRRSPKGSRPTASRRGPLTVFIHIPKTAGTTLISVLRGNFPPGGVRSLGNVFHGAGGVDSGPVVKLRQSGPVVTRDIHLLGGHLPFGIYQYLPSDSRYITFLRDPVERTLSHYYRARSVRKRDPIPEDLSFEDVLAGGDYLYDNLQTRMLSGNPEPFGEVTQEMLEQAKENLSERFICFGLADRFDESLVLLKRSLELNSILYVSQRMTTNRPRTQESKEDLTPIAERFNAYDIELYRWASEQFDRRVADQDADFAVELAALKTAVSGGRVTESPPAASKLSRGQMWEELVRARAGLLGWEYQVAKANEPDQSLLEELHTLLKQANENIVQLQERSEAVGSRAGRAAPELETHVEDVEGEAENGTGRERRKKRARAPERLEQLHGQIEELEKAIGDQPENTRDAHVVRELERLRALAAEVEQESMGTAPARASTDAVSTKAERRQTPAQRAARIAGLEKTRDSAAEGLARAQERLKEIRAQIEELEATNTTEGETPAGDAAGAAVRQEARIQRLRDLAATKEKRIEIQRVRQSELERRLSALTEEAASSGGGGEVAAEASPDGTNGA